MQLDPDPKMFLEADEEESADTLKDLMLVVWRRLWVIVLSATVIAVVSAGVSYTQTPMYEGSIKILVGQEQRDGVPAGNLGQDVQGLQQLTLTMAEAVATIPVARAVIEDLNLSLTPEEFLSRLTVQQVTNTQFISVSYSDTDPERAQQVASAVGDQFSTQVSEVSASANSITAIVWERSEVSDTPVSPRPIRNGLLGLALGGLLGVALVFVIEYLDDAWRSPTEVERISGVPNFGVIRAFDFSKAKSRAASKKGVR